MDHRSYIRTHLATILVTLIAILLGNILIDPYGLYELSRIDGLNQQKPEIFTHTRLNKAYAVLNLRPDAVALGTSRTDTGIDPEHPGWSSLATRHFNLGLSGANIYEILQYFRHAMTLNRVKQAVVDLDMSSFGAGQATSDFREDILAQNSTSSGYADLYWTKFAFLLSLDTLRSSLLTIQAQAHAAISFKSNGQRTAHSYNDKIRFRKGYHNYFLAAEEKLVATHAEKYDPTEEVVIDDLAPQAFEHLQSLLNEARRQGTDLKFFISPVHARFLETIRINGLWPQLEAWKRRIVALIAEDAARHPKLLPIPLWDFSGYNSLTTETVPPKDDAITSMKWYWEDSHFKKELGDFVLDRIFGCHTEGRVIPDDFGVMLTPTNIETHLAHIREEGSRYRATHPSDVAEIEALASVARVQQMESGSDGR